MSDFFSLQIAKVTGLSSADEEKLRELVKVYNYYLSANLRKVHYYEGSISLNEVNLGLALPDGLSKLEIGCSWGAKAVDVLAGLSMFDGFVDSNGFSADELTGIVERNRLIAEYPKACRDELCIGSSFATVMNDPALGCRIRFHSEKTAAALWNGEKGRIDCGFVIVDTKMSADSYEWIPTVLNLHTDDAVIVLRRVNDNDDWVAEHHPHRMGRPLMVPLTWNATSTKPFGRSRLKGPVRRLIDAYVRTIANATIGLEFSTAPQKYVLGITDEQYDAIINNKFKQYVGNIVAATTNPETGEKPTFGQLVQGNISPHVEMLRILATQFSSATGLSVTDTGVVNDANPTSADAVVAQSKTLTTMAEQLNKSNGESLKLIGQMALAIVNDTTLEGLTEEQKSIVPHFKNPAMPSLASTADAAIKIASAREGFAQTDVFMEMIGFDQADIRRIKAQESKSRGLALVNSLRGDET